MSRLGPNPGITKVAAVDNKFNLLDYVKPITEQPDVKAAKKMTKADGSLDTAQSNASSQGSAQVTPGVTSVSPLKRQRQKRKESGDITDLSRHDLAVIVDSGVSVAVFNPRVAAAYPLQEYEVSKNGDDCEIASAD